MSYLCNVGVQPACSHIVHCQDNVQCATMCACNVATKHADSPSRSLDVAYSATVVSSRHCTVHSIELHQASPNYIAPHRTTPLLHCTTARFTSRHRTTPHRTTSYRTIPYRTSGTTLNHKTLHHTTAALQRLQSKCRVPIPAAPSRFPIYM